MKLRWTKAPDGAVSEYSFNWYCNGRYGKIEVGNQPMWSENLPNWFWVWFYKVNPELMFMRRK